MIIPWRFSNKQQPTNRLDTDMPDKSRTNNLSGTGRANTCSSSDQWQRGRLWLDAAGGRNARTRGSTEVWRISSHDSDAITSSPSTLRKIHKSSLNLPNSRSLIQSIQKRNDWQRRWRRSPGLAPTHQFPVSTSSESHHGPNMALRATIHSYYRHHPRTQTCHPLLCTQN